MAANSPDKIHFSVDLADAERVEESKQREPFRAEIAGRVIVMTDAADLDWKVLLNIEHPVEFLRHCINDEDRDWLREQNIKGAVFNKMIEAYQRHYGLGERGNGIASRL